MTENQKEVSPAAIRTTEIMFGDDIYTVREVAHLRAKECWPILLDQIKPAFDELRSGGDIGADSTMDDLAGVVSVIERVVLEVPDAILDFICKYDAGLEAAREKIEATTTQRQLIMALLALLEMSDPFGLRRFLRGLTRQATSSSSVAPSGE